MYDYNHGERGRARNKLYATSGHKAAQEARWYYERGGWYVSARRALRRHLAENLQKLEAEHTA
jgi:hypothetical protein